MLALDALASPSIAGGTIDTINEAMILNGAQRIGLLSSHAREDIGLYFMIFAIAARPLEIARLEVRDFLDADGNVRVLSEMREEVAINGRSRPLYFRSARLNTAMNDYLAERVFRKLGLGVPERFRGLDSESRLFLSSTGRGFEITEYGKNDKRRYDCRGIQETYRKLFRYADLKGVTALSVRRIVADRLYARGADDSQVGLLLGIAERCMVRKRFPRRPISLVELTSDLV